jgi:tetratricopeptide (TPR) repeat protein
MRTLLGIGVLLAAFAAAALEDAPNLDGLAPEVVTLLTDARADTLEQVGMLESAAARADAWGRLGMAYHSRHLPHAAELAYSQAVAEADEPRWRYLRAIVMGERGEVSDALADYRRVTELDPGNMPAWYRLGAGLLLDGQLEAAQSALTQALRLAPDSAIVLAALGDVALAEGELETALERFSAAYEKAPEAGQLAYKLAMIHRRMGSMDKAQDWLRRRGDNDTRPAIDDPLLLEVAQMSQSGRFYVKAGEWAIERGDVAQAIVAFENAVALAPGDPSAGLALAYALSQDGQMEAALAETRRVLGFAESSADAWYTLAWLLRASADPDVLAEASAAVRESLSLAEDTRSRALAAALAMRAGDHATAAADYAALIGADPEQAYYYYWLGMAMAAGGNCEGRKALAKAVELRRSWGEAHLALARVEAICGAPELAARRVEALLAARNDTDMRITAAFAALGLGRIDAARQSAQAEAPHADAALVLEAIDAEGLPERPFALDSDRWIPPEAKP